MPEVPQDATDSQCRSGSNCVNGSCTPINGCGGGQERCADGCKNLLNDNNNCGSCERKVSRDLVRR